MTNIELIAKMCIDSQSYTYLQTYLFIKTKSTKIYKIEMSKYNYSLILELIGNTNYKCDYHTRKLYTIEDIRIMKANLNLTTYQIAKMLDRSVGSVNKKLKELRKKEGYKK